MTCIVLDSARQFVVVLPLDRLDPRLDPRHANTRVCLYVEQSGGYVASGFDPAGHEAHIGCVLRHFGPDEGLSLEEALALAGVEVPIVS